MTELPILKQLREELKKVERELRIEVPKELQKAAAHGDLRENAEYDAAKNRQSYLQSRSAQLTTRINTLASLKLDTLPKGAAGLGSRVTLEEIDTGDVVTYEIVTPEEVNPKEGKISVSSPVGRAILNKAEGDEVVIRLPAGVKEYELTELKTIHDLFLGDPK